MSLAGVKNIEIILEGGNVLTEATKGYTDAAANSANSAEGAGALLGLSGILFGLIGKFDSPFIKALATGLGINAGVLGVAMGGIQLADAIQQYRDAMAGYDGKAQQAAYENLADKTAGVLAGIGGAIAAVPGMQPIGLSIWLGATGAQQVMNGNLGRASAKLDDFFTEVKKNQVNDNAISPIIGTTPDPLVKIIKHRYSDPLVLDLDDDGLEITPLSKGIVFDANGDAIKTGTAWVGADDGMLVWDRNGNGIIDSGQELFGDETVLANGQKAANGFAALSELDKGSVVNGVTVGAGDGVFDAKDAQYANLAIWRDLNQDGISQVNEFKTLAQTGINSIKLDSATTYTNYGDAILTQSSTFTRTDNSTGQAGSFILAQNNFLSEFTPIAVSDAAKALPDFKGSGWVRDLQEAATLSPELIALFNQAKDAPTRAGYKNAVAELLREWSNDSGYSSASKQAMNVGYGLILSDPVDDQERGWMDNAIKATEVNRNAYRATLSGTDRAKFDAMRERMVGGLEKIQAYEAFTGYTFLNWAQVKGDAINYIPRESSDSGTYFNVLGFSSSAPLTQVIYENRNAFMSSQEGYIRVSIPTSLSDTPHIETLWNRLVDDATNNFMLTLRLSKYLGMVDLNISAEGATVDFSQLNATLTKARTESSLEGSALLLDLYHHYGTRLDRTGWNGAEQVRGLMLQAMSDVDIREAFKLTDFGFFTAGTSVFGSDNHDAYVGDANNNSFNAYGGDDVVDGQAGDDDLRGSGGDDVIFGGDGSDTLQGNEGNDHLLGGAGVDYLAGDNYSGGSRSGGDDVLDGGEGNDTLVGGFGSDTYTYGRGDGQDTIFNVGDIWDASPDPDPDTTKIDTLSFKAGIESSDVTLRHNGNDLVIEINDSLDQVTVTDYFVEDGLSSAGFALDRIQFADGTNWDVTAVKIKMLMGTAGDDRLTGFAGNDSLQGLAGNDILDGHAGDDKLDGGAGNDFLFGDGRYLDNGHYRDYSGNDVLDGGAGNDELTGGFGSDTYVFGRGDGQDTIFNAGVDGAADPDTTTIDTLLFKAGIAPSDVNVGRNRNDLVLKINSSTDQVVVSNYFAEDGHSSAGFTLERIQFADGTNWDLAAVKTKVPLATAGDDALFGYEGNDSLQGLAGNDELSGHAGDDLLDGGVGGDFLDGDDGDDTLYGGTGDDYLTGGFGSDTYLFGRGDGRDIIINKGYTTGGNTAPDPAANKIDTLSFKAGITPSDVSVIRNEDDLVLKIKGGTDQVTVWGYFVEDGLSSAGYALERIQFTDGTTWDVAAVKGKVPLGGTAGDDVLIGYEGNDRMQGLAGKDLLYGHAGDDLLDGGEGDDNLHGDDGADTSLGGEGDDVMIGGNGDDTLYGGAGNDSLDGDGNSYDNDNGLWGLYSGNDVLDGGAGDDSLSGGLGSDTYLFGRGYGSDYIYRGTIPYRGDPIPDANSTDILSFKAGIAPSDVSVNRNGNNLVLKINGSTDQVTVPGYFVEDGLDNAGYGLERIQFDDGTTWDVAAVKKMYVPLGGTTYDDTLNCYEGNSSLQGLAGNDTLHGDASDNFLDGGNGNDLLVGRDGADTLLGGHGDDLLYGGSGDDSLHGGAGNDYLASDGQYSVDAYAYHASGNDELDGGVGDDYLLGGLGQDSYNFELGDGQDTVDDLGSDGAATRLVLGKGITAQAVKVTQTSDGYRIATSGQDSITLTGLSAATASTANISVVFTDTSSAQSQWSLAQLMAAASTNTNHAPTVHTPLTAQSAHTAELFSYVIPIDGPNATFADQDIGDALSLYAYLGNGNALPSWLHFDAPSHSFSGTPTSEGSLDIQLTATDKASASVSSSFTLAVETLYPSDALIGTAGTDTLKADPNHTHVYGLGGDDIINGFWESSTLVGGAGNDTLNALGGAANTLDGGDGDDTLIGAWGNDHLNGGEGNNTIRITGDAAIVTAGFGNDTITNEGWARANINAGDGDNIISVTIATSGSADIVAGSGNDDISGGWGFDVINAGGGNNTVRVRGNSAIVTAGAGNDTILSHGWGHDNINAGDGNNLIDITTGSTVVVAGAGDDDISTGWENDVINAGDGNNTVHVRGNSATITAGAGNDTILSHGWGHDNINAGDGNNNIDITTGDTVVVAGSGDDTVSGGWGHDVIDAGGGNNTVRINSGSATVTTGAGNDVVNGNWRDDILRVGDGDNRVNTGGGNDLVIAGKGRDVLTGVWGNETLVAGDGDNTVDAGDGHNVVISGAGTDTLIGEGSNIVFAGAGNDSLTFGWNSDWINAGLGNDRIDTGGGNNLIAFQRGDGADTVVNGSWNRDTISLGAGIRYADLSLQKDGNNLILKLGSGASNGASNGAGQSDSITLTGWYDPADIGDEQHHGVGQLQVLTQGGDYVAGSSNSLTNKPVTVFNFVQLVQRFDAARATDSSAANGWAVAPSLAATQQYADDVAPINYVNPWVALQAGTDLVTQAGAIASNPITTAGTTAGEQLLFAALNSTQTPNPARGWWQ